jgi:hypothetical protein
MGAVVKALTSTVPGEIGAARVTNVIDRANVEVARAGARSVQASVLDAARTAIQVGDTVLLAAGHDGEHYVLGLLGGVVRTSDGVSAEIDGEPGDEVLRVRDGAGRLLFEYDATARRSTVCAPEGDLALAADTGAIRLTARDGVTVKTDGALDLDTASTLHVKTPHLDAVAKRADLSAETAHVTARAITTTAEKARALIGVIETTATRIVERARSAYRETEELSQTKAGRMRLLVKQTFQVLGKRTLVRAEQDVRVDGDKIYLG